MDSWVIFGVCFILSGTIVTCFSIWSRLCALQRRATDAKQPSQPFEERLRLLETRVKAVETEWDQTYEQLRRAVGRASRDRALDLRGAAVSRDSGPQAGIAGQSRSDLLRRHREQTVLTPQ